jgi:hypothetical protein
MLPRYRIEQPLGEDTVVPPVRHAFSQGFSPNWGIIVTEQDSDVSPEDTYIRAGAFHPPPTRWKQYNAFIDQLQNGLTANEKVVWFVLFRHANKHGRIQKVSQKRIARAAGLHLSTVKNAYCTLQKHALLQVVNRGRSGRSSSLRLLMPTQKNGVPGRPL